jgi:hypothetical protein
MMRFGQRPKLANKAQYYKALGDCLERFALRGRLGDGHTAIRLLLGSLTAVGKV